MNAASSENRRLSAAVLIAALVGILAGLALDWRRPAAPAGSRVGWPSSLVR